VTLKNRCTRFFRQGVSRARYYQPGTGRFWTADDGEQGDEQDPKSLHLYSYCELDPVNNTDASGHDIGDMLTVMDVGSSLFSAISPATSIAANRILNSDTWTVER
jgi:hypothetical protein